MTELERMLIEHACQKLQMLYGVGQGDLVTYAGVAVLLPLVAVLAAALPALRATRIDPARAMRAE